MLLVSGLVTMAQALPGNEQKKFYYRDVDGDAYGDPAQKVLAASCPVGYVADSTDCDDNDTDTNPETIWFKDEDADGYGNRSFFYTGCIPPTGKWVMNNWDADDTKMSAYTDDELVLICNTRGDKEEFTKWKNLAKKQGEGWVPGPCGSACDPGLIQVCHNGKLHCVTHEKLSLLLERGWIKGPCLQPVSSSKSPDVQPRFPIAVADDEKTFVYPNPTNGEIFVRLPKLENGRVEIFIISANGTVVEKRAKQPGGQTERFDLSKSGAGIYLVKVMTAAEVEVFRVVFQRSFVQQ